MTDQQMMAAILKSIQTDSNLMTMMRAAISNNIGNLNTAHLQALCAALGIDTGAS